MIDTQYVVIKKRFSTQDIVEPTFDFGWKYKYLWGVWTDERNEDYQKKWTGSCI